MRSAILLSAAALAAAFCAAQAPAEAPRGARSASAAERFKQFDRNGDGAVTADELGSPELFKLLDKDGDGRVAPEEARAYVLSRQEAQAAGSKPAALPPAPEMNKALNVRYAEAAGVAPNLLSLDAYSPKDDQKHPVMIMIHGGGWRAGDKANAGVAEVKSRHFVAAGYVFVSINYRLSPAVVHPVHVQDVAKAVAWVHTNIARHGGDPDRLFLIGHSAGAHLAALVASDERRLKAEGKDLGILKGVVLLDGAAYDLPDQMKRRDIAPAGGATYEIAFGKDETAWADASPRLHVAAGKGIPPFLVFYTPRPTAGPQSNNLADTLVKAGVPARAFLAADKDHGGIMACIGQPGDPYTRLVMEFLKNPAGVAQLRLEQPAGAPKPPE
jgi:acetyl esterase/lipase